MLTRKKFNRLTKILERFLNSNERYPSFPKIIITEFKKEHIWDLWVYRVNKNSNYVSAPMKARREEYQKFIEEYCKPLIL